MLKIAASILSANFAVLGQEIIEITKAGADYVHIDVMDGHFVPNITIGPDVIKAIRSYSELPFDVHLMIENADHYIERFANSGADIITVHAEAIVHLERTIKLIKSFGKKVGVSLVPTTPPDILKYILPEIDQVLVMSVNPGFGGQQFIYSQLDKICHIKQMIASTGLDIKIEVDGGITKETAQDVINSGADILVSGSYLFDGGQAEYRQRIDSLRRS